MSSVIIRAGEQESSGWPLRDEAGVFKGTVQPKVPAIWIRLLLSNVMKLDGSLYRQWEGSVHLVTERLNVIVKGVMLARLVSFVTRRFSVKRHCCCSNVFIYFATLSTTSQVYRYMSGGKQPRCATFTYA